MNYYYDEFSHWLKSGMFIKRNWLCFRDQNGRVWTVRFLPFYLKDDELKKIKREALTKYKKGV